MTKIALFQMRCGAASCYPPELHATIYKIDAHYRPDHGRQAIAVSERQDPNSA
jgi:hypothetical protein